MSQRILALSVIATGLVTSFLTAAEAPPAKDPPAKGPNVEAQFGRERGEIIDAFKPVLTKVSRSIVPVRADKKVVALAVAVHQDGYLVTKLSELVNPPSKDPDDKPAGVKDLECEFPNGLRLIAQVVDKLPIYDIALLKVEARGLVPVVWSESPTAPAPGTFLAAPSPAGDALAVGISSVRPRALVRGFLGVLFGEKSSENDKGVPIKEVTVNTAAERAGLKSGDFIIAVDGIDVADRFAFTEVISSRSPGQVVKLKVRRQAEEKEFVATLGTRPKWADSHPDSAFDPTMRLAGRLSADRDGYLNVLQHDLTLKPEECGGPLIDLDGRAVGLNIARAGRIESYAVPASDLRGLLREVGKGHFCLPDVNSLRNDLKEADLTIARAREAREAAEKALERAKVLLDASNPPQPPKALAAKPDAPKPAPEAKPKQEPKPAPKTEQKTDQKTEPKPADKPAEKPADKPADKTPAKVEEPGRP